MSLRYRTWLCSRIHMMNYGAHSLALMPSVWVTELSADFEGHTTATCSQECVSMKDHTCGHIDIRPTKTIIDCPVGLQPCPCTHARTHTRTQIKWVRVWTCSLSLALISCRLAKILHTHQSRRMWEREWEREWQGKEMRNLQRKSWVAFASSRKVECWVGGFVHTESFRMRVWITVWDAGSAIAYLYSDYWTLHTCITHRASAGRILIW